MELLAKTKRLSKNKYNDVINPQIENAVSWFITAPAETFLFDTTFAPEDLKDLRLPYRDLFIEYELSPTKTRNKEVQSACFMHEAIDEGDIDTIVFGSFFRVPGGNWLPTGTVNKISYKSFERVNEWAILYDDGDILIPSDKAKKDADGIPIGVDTYNTKQRDVLTEIYGKRKAAEIDNIIRMRGLVLLLKLLIVLDCSNVPLETIRETKLNNINRLRKKPLVPDYNILKITPYEEQERIIKASGGVGVSPRTHRRRGHIHRFHTKKGLIKKWLQPMIINAQYNDPIPKETLVV